MNKKGPVVVIEDDLDDQGFLTEIFTRINCPNKLIFFQNGSQAYDFLSTTEEIPFIILSDVNMPYQNGFDLKKKIKANCESGVQCVPFLFFSTTSTKKILVDAYTAATQGFFIKDSSLVELEITIKVIMEYWKRCVSPNNFSTTE
ncbi:MAG TPA: response regulator [Puia sp.]|nr:response regulator [Puia sp.]